jgi:hypothetical protein
MSREIMQQALDALKLGGLIKKTQAIATLKAELAKPEPTQEQIYEIIIRWNENGGKRSRRELTRQIVALLNREHITDGTLCWCDPVKELAKPEQEPEPEPEPEPVAWVYQGTFDKAFHSCDSDGIGAIPLYFSPPRKKWVGLTEDEISLMAHNDDDGDWNDPRYRSCWLKGYFDGGRAIESKLKELNK